MAVKRTFGWVQNLGDLKNLKIVQDIIDGQQSKNYTDSAGKTITIKNLMLMIGRQRDI